jgi:alkanesulfonate monooxygenase SsuD/methylene tetrahydromethanopterin reductase-like flavin-dependent oxidoreductase (luciferase family)
MPIIVGGTGPVRTPRLAGSFADEYNMAFMPAEEMEARVGRARDAAARAGRDPDALRVSVMAGAVVGRDEAAFRKNLDRVAAHHPMGRSAGQIEESLRRRGLPMGPPAEARQAVSAMAEAGIDRFYVQHLGPFDHDLLEEVFDVLRG